MHRLAPLALVLACSPGTLPAEGDTGDTADSGRASAAITHDRPAGRRDDGPPAGLLPSQERELARMREEADLRGIPERATRPAPETPPQAPIAPAPLTATVHLLDLGPRDGGTLQLSVPLGGPAGPTFEAWDELVAATGTPVPAARWHEVHVDLAGAWWILPDHGPAVPATIAGVTLAWINECHGVPGHVVAFDAVLPQGARGVAATRGTPPPSWRSTGPTPRLSPAAAEARIRSHLGLSEGAVVDLGPEGAGHRAQVRTEHLPPDGRWEVTLTTVHVTADAITVLEAPRTIVPDLPLFDESAPVTVRDLDGDGAPDLVEGSACGIGVTLSSGEPLRSPYRCCGC